MKNSEQRLGVNRISSLLMEFSIPAITGMVVNAIYNVVDRIFIGQTADLGKLGISGITITQPITMILMALSLMAGVGGATRFSISLGSQQKDKAAKYLGNAFSLTVFFGSMFMIFGNLFINPVLKILGANSEILPYAKEYLSIILFGAVFQCVSMVGNNFSRAQGNPKNAMISQLIGALFNILFDYILIVRLGMGMKGAALATIGGQFLSMIWQLAFLFGNRSIIRLTFRNMVPEKVYLLSIITIGIPAFLMQLANSLLNIVLNKVLEKHGGTNGIASIGVITSFQMLMLMPIAGLTQGQQPIISYNFGAKRLDRAKETLKLSIIVATCFSIVGFTIIQLFPGFIIRMFNDDPAVIDLTTYGIRIWFMCLPIIGSQMVCSNFFQAIGKIKIASFLNLCRQVIILTPLIVLFSSLFGLNGIFFAVPVSDSISFLLTMFLIKRESKNWGLTEINEDQDQAVLNDTVIVE